MDTGFACVFKDHCTTRSYYVSTMLLYYYVILKDKRCQLFTVVHSIYLKTFNNSSLLLSNQHIRVMKISLGSGSNINTKMTRWINIWKGQLRFLLTQTFFHKFVMLKNLIFFLFKFHKTDFLGGYFHEVCNMNLD